MRNNNKVVAKKMLESNKSVIYVYITIIMRKKIQLLEDEVSSGKGSTV
jgi:hypothetical protein